MAAGWGWGWEGPTQAWGLWVGTCASLGGVGERENRRCPRVLGGLTERSHHTPHVDPLPADTRSRAGRRGLLLILCSVPPTCTAHPACRFGFGVPAPHGHPSPISPGVLAHPWGMLSGHLGLRGEPSWDSPGSRVWPEEGCQEGKGASCTCLFFPGIITAARLPRGKCWSRAGQTAIQTGPPSVGTCGQGA